MGVDLEMGAHIMEAMLASLMDLHIHVKLCPAWFAAWRRTVALVRYRGAGALSFSSKLSNRLTPKLGSPSGGLDHACTLRDGTLMDTTLRDGTILGLILGVTYMLG
jgi:hypothetical protein